jgi:uncharacterized membrane protein
MTNTEARARADQAGRGLATDRHLAVAAASLYLANLLILHGIAFLILLALAGWRKQERGALASAHLQQAIGASLWAGGLLIGLVLLVLGLAELAGLGIWACVSSARSPSRERGRGKHRASAKRARGIQCASSSR